MRLTESNVEDAALEWFGELVPQLREIEHGPDLAPGEYAGGTLTPTLSQGERESYSEVVLAGRLREASRRPAVAGPAIPPSRTFATLRDPAVAGLPRLLSGELSVAEVAAP